MDLKGTKYTRSVYSPSESLGKYIRDRLSELKLTGKKGTVSTSCTTKESQAYALVDAIRGDPLLKDKILRAGHGVTPMKCSDLGPQARYDSYTDTVSGHGIPLLASLLLSDDDGKF